MKKIIIIPTYNEKENISSLIDEIFSLQIPDLELIVVDDNSPDNTATAVEEKAKQYPIHIIKRKAKMGLGSAYIAGFKKALSLDGKLIFEMDADHSHNPKDLPRMIEAGKNAEVVIASRKINHGSIEGWNWWRKFMSTGAMIASRLFLGLKTKDVTAGYRCYNSSFIKKIPLDKIKSNGYAFQEEMVYRAEKAGYVIKEIPVTFIDRQKGKSKLSRKDIIEFFVVMLKLRFTRLQ